MIHRISSYDDLHLGNIPSIFWEGFPNVFGKKVFIKPNLVTPPVKWDKSSTTRVEVVDLVIQYLNSQGCNNIIIGDCGFKDQWELTIQASGYQNLVDKYNVQLIGLQEGPRFHEFTLQRLDNYLSLFGAKLSNVVLDCDIIINIPKLKVHKMALVTGAIKNMMGCMAQKGSMHPKSNIGILHKRLHDLYFLTKDRVGFCVMDGIEGSEYSEQYGVPKVANVLISNVDMANMDVYACKVMGIDPNKVGYLNEIKKTYKTPNFDFYQIPPELITLFELPLGYRNI